MKKTIYLLVLFVFTMTLAACHNQNDTGAPPSTGADNAEIDVKDVEGVDVLNRHGGIEGLERIVHFYDNVKNDVASDLRIVHYTIEGDPLVTDLHYDGQFLEVTDDTTRDKFGHGAITTVTCGDLIEEINPTDTTYIAVDCADEFYGMQEILRINYNLGQQDFFEFVLKYGVNNEHDTLTNTVKIDTIASGAQTIGNLQAATSMQQEVYKRLVLANYLAEKNFTTSCATKESINYDLQVRINGGQRDYQWNACDESVDGINFTNIANYIIEQSDNEQSRQPKATVQGYVLEINDNEMLIAESLTMLDYEWLKDELQHINFEDYHMNFIVLEDVETTNFKLGDKVLATIEGEVTHTKPWRAKAEEIVKINIR